MEKEIRDMNVKELKALAKERGIKRYYWLRKAQLIESLETETPPTEAPEIMEAPENEIMEAPENEIMEAPETEIMEAPETEIMEAPENEIMEAPETEIMEAPEKHLRLKLWKHLRLKLWKHLCLKLWMNLKLWKPEKLWMNLCLKLKNQFSRQLKWKIYQEYHPWWGWQKSKRIWCRKLLINSPTGLLIIFQNQFEEL